MPDIATSVFGYSEQDRRGVSLRSHIAIDRTCGFIRGAAVTDAACHDCKMLRCLVTSVNPAARVWAGPVEGPEVVCFA